MFLAINKSLSKSLIYHFSFFLFLFFCISCEKTTAPVNKLQLTLTAEYVGVTEADLLLQTKNTEANTQYQLFRDDSLVSDGNLIQAETIIIDTLLSPAHHYSYQAFLIKDQKRIAKSEKRRVITLDTTGHDFTWETYTFGDYSSVLRDVAIVDEDNIWAVGEIYFNDSTGQPDPHLYNAVHWDGSQWELKRIPTNSVVGLGFYPINTVFAFDADNIWMFSDAGSYCHWNGTTWQSQYVPERQGGINKIWGSSPTDLYFVGTNGNITHYNGQSWQKLESGTDVDLLDVWGSHDSDVVWICGWQDFKPTVLIKIENKSVKKVFESRNFLFSYDPDTISGAVYSLWVDEFDRIYALTNYDLYRCQTNTNGEGKAIWRKNKPYIWASRKVRGTSLNNIVSVGNGGLIWYFNGMHWENFQELINSNDRLRSVAINGNIIVVAGYRYINPVEICGLIYFGRR